MGNPPPDPGCQWWEVNLQEEQRMSGIVLSRSSVQMEGSEECGGEEEEAV